MDEKVLDKYIKGTATSEERQLVIDWLDADEQNVREMMALHKLNDIAVMNQMEAVKTEVLSQEVAKGTMRWRRVVGELLKVAAVVLVLLGIQFLMKQDTVGQQTLYVPGGQRAELILPDGTKVWLNSRTRLAYPLNFEEVREVKLDGEAYFSVVRNETSPFVVKACGLDVKVLGTEFNVKAYAVSDERQVDLLKGSVELSGGVMGDKNYLMQPDECVRVAEGKIESTRIKDDDYFRWKEGLICFDNENIGDIIKKLELYYDVHITIERTDFLEDTYSGKFRSKDGIDQVLKVLQLEYDFTYVKDNNLNLITIK